MSGTFTEFRATARAAIANPRLQQALEGATGRFMAERHHALAEMPDADALRDQLKAIRSATIANLAHHLEQFEQQATARGARVHWARDGAEANRIVLEIASRHGVEMVVKSKSMVTEEIHLNQALADQDIRPVETDLGEWIIQLAGEMPSHIIAPAIHKSRQQVADLLSIEAGKSLSADNISDLTEEARRLLRERFLAAGLGISGVNVGIAESGTVVLVSNEGNGRLVTSAPPVHIAIMGVEKLVPTWDEAAVWLALLARSATGQPLSMYTSFISGPARADDPDGPKEVHVILLDNGRVGQVGGPFEEALECIRCGACLNVCPVYREAGGHAYNSPYSGPIGAVITPLFFGLEDYEALPQASTLCGACLDVCPSRIDIPRMLLELRAQEVEEGVLPWHERVVERAAAFVMARPRLYGLVAKVLRLGQPLFLRQGRLRLPSRLNPAPGRELPVLSGRSFHEMWEKGEVE